MTARCIMVLGTSSGAGKSWIATALCRHYANQGLKVAPFKAQNMSNNARVVPAAEGQMGEIGSAQYFQALAARAVPDVRMNPLLLKPEADTRSQVVLMGQVSRELTDLPWRSRSERVWPHIAAALDALIAENDVVVIEGAGSPAEINLMASDVVNLRVARHANARCLLVADIDRGGAFAHLYGTWALLPEDDRKRIAGFVLNKFRGDAALLAPAPEQLQQLTGVPTVAVIPMRFGHGLPEEDGVFDDRAWHAPSPSGRGLGWGPAAPPMGAAGPSPQRGEGAGPARLGGDMDLLPLPLAGEGGGEGAPSPAGGGLGWGQTAPAIGAAGPSPQPSPQRGEGASPARVPGSVDFLPLPLAGEGRGEGAPPITHIAIVATPRISNLDEFQPLKNVPGVTLSWARTPAALHGADTLILPGSKATAADLAWLRAQGLDAAIAAHAAAGGRVLGICGGLQMLGEALIDVHGVESQGNAPGLGLLPLVTSFEPQKTVRRTTTRFGELAGAWGALSGVPVSGYEIHSGQTAQHPARAAKGDVAREVIPGLAWQNAAGNVMGCYLHGLFEDAAVLRALFGARAPSLDDVFDRLVDTLAQACAPGVLDALIAP